MVPSKITIIKLKNDKPYGKEIIVDPEDPVSWGDFFSVDLDEREKSLYYYVVSKKSGKQIAEILVQWK